MKPKKNDKVHSAYAGRDMRDGSKAPAFGTVVYTTRTGLVFVNYGIGDAFHSPELASDLVLVRGAWAPRYMAATL